MTKQELRKQLLEKRSKANQNTIRIISENIQKNFLESDLYKNCKEILVYVSTAREIATNKITDIALRDNKKIFCPLCLEQKGIMEFLRIYSEDDLEAGKYNIYAPKQGLPKAKNLKKPVMIVPALAFDENGFRIGYGGGYYDRYLSSHKNITTVGFCREENLYGNLPHDEFDKPVDIIITERRTIFVRGE